MKEPTMKYLDEFPLKLTYIYSSVSSLYNNYHWGRGLGCTFQKYNHLPGKGSVAQKNQLINNFMDSIKKLKDANVSQECIVPLFNLCLRVMHHSFLPHLN